VVDAGGNRLPGVVATLGVVKGAMGLACDGCTFDRRWWRSCWLFDSSFGLHPRNASPGWAGLGFVGNSEGDVAKELDAVALSPWRSPSARTRPLMPGAFPAHGGLEAGGGESLGSHLPP